MRACRFWRKKQFWAFVLSVSMLSPFGNIIYASDLHSNNVNLSNSTELDSGDSNTINTEDRTESSVTLEGILFSEDFEAFSADQIPTDWKVELNPQVTQKIVSLELDSGAEHGMVLRTDTNGKLEKPSGYVTRSFDPVTSGKLEVEMDVYPHQKNGAGYIVLTDEGGIDANKVIHFQFDASTGKMGINNGGFKGTVSYNANQWYHIKFALDLNQKKYNIYVDGDSLYENQSFNNLKTSSISKLCLGSGYGFTETFYYDNITVRRPAPVKPQEITLSAKTLQIQRGINAALKAVVTPDGAEYDKILWNSKDEEIATVSETGMITANAVGQTEITAAIKDYPEITANCKITVTEVAGLPWEETFESYELGSKTTEPTWSHTGSTLVDFSVAQDQNNKFVKIATNGMLAASETSPFMERELPAFTTGRRMFTLKFYPYQTNGVGYIYLNDGEKDVLQFNVNKDGNIVQNVGGTPKTLMPYQPNTWQTLGLLVDMDNQTVDCYLDGEEKVAGLTFTADQIVKLKIGVGRGYATEMDIDQIEIDVAKAIPAEKLQLDRTALWMSVHETEKLNWRVIPNTVHGMEVLFTSSDEQVATVDETGLVTAVAPGTAKVRVSAKEIPELYAECEVTVTTYGIERLYYVDPAGEDSNPGTKEKPFASIERARDAVRATASDMKGNIIVYLRGGVYTLNDTLVFNESDSGTNGFEIIYKAYENEDVVVSGGKTISGWEPLDGTNIYYAQSSSQFDTRQLYVDGVRASRARSTDGLPGSTYNETGHTTTDTSMANWKNQSDIEMVYKQNWTNPRCGVESITLNGNKAVIAMKQPGYKYCRNKLSTSTTNPWYIENAFELLDEQGEWYLDKTGDIGHGAYTYYYIPRDGEDMESAQITAAKLESLVDIKGTLEKPVHHIRFENISFQHATWLRPNTNSGHPDAQNNIIREYAPEMSISNHKFREFTPDGAVNLEYSHNISFQQCDFRKLGSTGIVGKSGCSDTLIKDSAFTDLSGGAIMFGEVDMYTEDFYNPSDERRLFKNNQVINNLIDSVAVEYRSAAAVGAAFPVDMKIRDNTISNLPYCGLHLGWGWTKRPTFATRGGEIIGNHIYNVMQVLNDGGAIYTLGYTSGSKDNYCLVSENYLHGQKNNFAALYQDEGSDYHKLTNNVIEDINGIKWTLNKEASNIYQSNYIDTANASSPSDLSQNVVVTDGAWPEEAQAIMSSAGQKAFETTADPKPLEELVALSDGIDSLLYTPESWAALEQAVENAKALLAQTQFSQTMLEEHWFALRRALENLVPAGSALQITQQPNDQFAYQGESATFDLTAESLNDGTLSYQWEYSKDQGATWIAIDGANQNSYSTNSLSLSDDGLRFRCIVTNQKDSAVDSITSNEAALVVRLKNSNHENNGTGSSESTGSSGGGSLTLRPTRTSLSETQAMRTLNQSLAAAKKAGKKSVQTIVHDQTLVSAKTLQKMQAVLLKNGMEGTLLAETTNPKAAPGKIKIQLADAEKMVGDIQLGVHTAPDRIRATKGIFEKYFKNQMTFVQLSQQSSFGAKVEIMVKIDLPSQDLKELYLYSYDQKTNRYVEHSKETFFIDKENNLHLFTDLGGSVIISKGPISKK